MSLNITVLSRSHIYQSGDFRLVDRHGQRVNFEAQKQIQITRFRWSAVVAFVGIGSVRGLNVSEWLTERTNELRQNSDFSSLIQLLLSANEWIGRMPLHLRFHTFSVGAFLLHRPIFALVSNFEAVNAPPARVPRPKLQVTSLRPRSERVVVTGRFKAVTRIERRSLIGLLRSGATPESAMNALARVNASAHHRDSEHISEECLTSYVRLTGEGGGRLHGRLGRPFVPKSLVPPGFEDAIGKLLLDRFPQGTGIRSFSSGRSPASEAEHLARIRENPDDPSLHSNYGSYLREEEKDDARAEEAYLRALDLDPRHSHALGNLANIMWDRGELDRAESLYRQSLHENPANVIHRINLGKFLFNSRGDLDAALAVCEKGVAEGTDNFGLLRLHSDLLARRGEYTRAVKQYRRLYDMRPEATDVALLYGTMLQVTGAPPEEIEPLYRQVLAEEPTNGSALLNLAQVRLQVGAIPESRALLRRALQAQLTDDQKVEALYCWYAVESHGEALRELRSLLISGARSRGWDLAPVTAQAVNSGRDEADLLRVLGAIVADRESVDELDAFSGWRALGNARE